jgi:hypothetical protein
MLTLAFGSYAHQRSATYAAADICITLNWVLVCVCVCVVFVVVFVVVVVFVFVFVVVVVCVCARAHACEKNENLWACVSSERE